MLYWFCVVVRCGWLSYGIVYSTRYYHDWQANNECGVGNDVANIL